MSETDNILDASKDNKEIIKQIKQDHEQELRDINYAIDIKTGKVKENDMFYFYADYLTINHNYNLKDDISIKELNLRIIESIKEFKSDIKKYKNKKYKNIDKLNKDIYNFNNLYDTNYYNGFNARLKDLLDKDIQREFIQKRANAIAHIQTDSILKIGMDNFIKLDLKDIYNKQLAKDKRDDSFKIYVNLSDLNKLQDYYIENINSSNELPQNISDAMLFESLYNITSNNLIISINNEIDELIDIYKEVHKLYKQINQDIISIVKNFITAYESLNISNKLVIQQPSTKNIPLLAPTIFNKTYSNNEFTKIYANKELTLQIKLDLDIKMSDFRENIIFYDNLTQKRIDLLPIDYAIFIACTELNANNKSLSGISGNVPISIDSIVQYIADNDKLYRTKARQKALYNYIKDRLALYRCCIVDAIYTKNNVTKKLYKEPMPILYTNIYYNPTTQEEEYIIGASAVLTIINQIEILENRQYLASYTRAREFINDGQNNTIEILNIKYYILPKLLQKSNSKGKGDVYNPIISLEDMYKSLAILKEKDELTRQEQKRARDNALTFLQHLKSKGLLQAYDTKPLKNTSKLDNKLAIKGNQKITHLYTRPNYKASL